MTSVPEDSEFDRRVRAEMAHVFEPGNPPDTLLRKPAPWLGRQGMRRTLVALVIAVMGSSTVLAMRPASLVRDAIEHEHHERALRGIAVEQRPVLARLGLGQAQAVPDFPQLLRLCDIDGRTAYHLTTYFDKGGMVTVFAFEGPIDLKDSGGWWAGVHWRVIRSHDKQPLLLISATRTALGVAQSSLLQGRG